MKRVVECPECGLLVFVLGEFRFEGIERTFALCRWCKDASVSDVFTASYGSAARRFGLGGGIGTRGGEG